MIEVAAEFINDFVLAVRLCKQLVFVVGDDRNVVVFYKAVNFTRFIVCTCGQF